MQPGLCDGGPYTAARVRGSLDERRLLALSARANHTSVDSFLSSPDVEEWLALDELEQDKCPKHGGPSSECGDADADWFPQRSVCYPAMQLAAINALYDKRHKDKPYHDGLFRIWGEARTGLTPFHYREGVSLWISRENLSPEDDFLGQGER